VGENKPWRSRAVKVPGLKRKTEFYIFELLALAFGASASQFFFVHQIRWQQIVICCLGYVTSFVMMISVKCTHCKEPIGKVDGKWVPFAHDQCSRCGRDHG